MNRLHPHCRLTVTILLVAITATAQAHAGAYEVGLLSLISSSRPQIRGLRDGLKQFGYIDGRNLRLHTPRSITVNELEAVARSYKEMKLDVVVTAGGVETRVAKEAGLRVPIVLMPVTEPVKSGFVKSLSHPGTNMTGISFTSDVREHGKPLQVFKEIDPNLNSLAVLYDPRHPATRFGLREVRKTASFLKIDLFEVPVKTIAEATHAVSSIEKSKVQGVYLVCSSLFANPSTPALVAKKRKLPFHACTTDLVENGTALFAYARDFYSIGCRGAWYVHQILKGSRPQDLPVESPMKFELVINLAVGREIGLNIPPEVLMMADKVIK